MSTSAKKSSALTVGIEAEGLLIFKTHHLRQVLKPGQEIITTGTDEHGNRLDRMAFSTSWAIRSWDSKQKRFHYSRYVDDEPQKIIMDMFEDGEQEMEMSSDEDQDGADAGEVKDTTTDHQQQQPAFDTSRFDSGVSSEGSVASPGEDDQAEKGAETVYKTRSSTIIKRDLSILPLSTKDKKRLQPPNGPGPDEVDNADFEVTTKPYRCVDEIPILIQDLEDLRDAIKSGGGSIAVKNDCGLHVHVGYDDDSRMSLRALAFHAIIYLFFEKELARLHKPHRVVDVAGSYSRPNLSRFPAAEWGHEYKYHEDGKTPRLRSKYAGIETLRGLFAEYDAEADEGASLDTEYELLKNLASKTRRFALNYQNIDGINKKPAKTIIRPATIEFRAHAGTFDPVEIGHAAYLASALVSKAIELAETLENDADLLSYIESLEDTDLHWLLDWLELPDATRTYYKINARPKEDPENVYWEACDENGEPTSMQLDDAAKGDYALDDGMDDEELEDFSHLDDVERRELEAARRKRRATELGWRWC